jgi:hypothetical protein
MVFDPRRAHAVLVGGFFSDPLCPGGCPAALGDVWTWDRTQWTRRTVAAPSARGEHATAYDPDRGCLVIFGGGLSRTQPFTTPETWELCGDHWVQKAGRQPAGRVSAAMAYDPIRKQIVLFGGTNASGVVMGDTWLWDGTTWTAGPVSTTGPGPSMGPPPRTEHAIAFDPVAGMLLMFGGRSGNVYLGDTWVWNGTDWVRQTPPLAPPARSKHTIVTDPIRRRIVMLGGDDGAGTRTDHWEWEMGAWVDHSSMTLPPARNDYGVAWSGPRHRLVLFGGVEQFSVFDDIWEGSGDVWSQQFASGGPRPRFAHSFVRARDGILVFGGDAGGVVLDDLWRLRWDDREANELCTITADTDGDGLAGCADPDCWAVCTPLCPPGSACPASAPRCGDGTCNTSLETCRMCPGDCGACTAVCGDDVCDTTESVATCPGDCP